MKFRFRVCQNGRDAILRQSMSVQGHLEEKFWITMACFTGLLNEVNGIACEILLVDDRIGKPVATCAPVHAFPVIPAYSDHVRFVYNRSDNLSDAPEFWLPDYRNSDATDSTKSTMVDVIMHIEEHFHACDLDLRNNDETFDDDCTLPELCRMRCPGQGEGFVPGLETGGCCTRSKRKHICNGIDNSYLRMNQDDELRVDGFKCGTTWPCLDGIDESNCNRSRYPLFI